MILFLSRINWIKGLDFLIESFYELTKYRSDIILVIVGKDEGYKSKLDALINNLGISDKILFTGFLSGDEKLSALVDADVLVQTSVYEHGTGTPFEAILCNTAVIVTKHTGSGENINKINGGYLVEYGNKNELRDLIQYILNNPAEAQAKTQKAKEYIKNNLSISTRIKEYENLYRVCIAQNKVLEEYKK